MNYNPTKEQLYEDAIQNFGYKISSNGSLVALSGEKTGRSPKDKRIVLTEKTKDIWWGNVNIPISKQLYNIYKDYAILYLNNHKNTYKVDLYAGWDKNNQLKIRLYCYNPYHALFMQNMLIPATESFNDDDIDFTIYNVGHLKLSSVNVNSVNINLNDISLKDTLISLNFDDMTSVIYGSDYAGEMKKSILTLYMYLMPLQGHLPLHSSANINDDNKVSLFFGLSGTGKTTLSADPKRYLIGDDEHVWTNNGIFNIEGGCYAKCVNLDEDKEPDIFKAIRYGSVLENVIMNNQRIVDYTDISITENTRCAFPLYFIDKVKIPAIGNYPNNIILLTCDASGLLPPVAKLNKEQAVFMFICGYTSLIGSTVSGETGIKPIFSSCFGEPFLIWSPKKYGDLLKQKLEQYETNVWIVNTGWIGGEYGKGKRISIKYSRSIIDAIHNEKIGEYEEFPFFKFQIPKYCENVPSEILDPRNTTLDDNYLDKLRDLHNKFIDNYNLKCN